MQQVRNVSLALVHSINNNCYILVRFTPRFLSMDIVLPSLSPEFMSVDEDNNSVYIHMHRCFP